MPERHPMVFVVCHTRRIYLTCSRGHVEEISRDEAARMLDDLARALMGPASAEADEGRHVC
jgi:hypothetical protein